MTSLILLLCLIFQDLNHDRCQIMDTLKASMKNITKIKKVHMKDAPINYRCNNPGNLRPGRIMFRGQIGLKNDFAVFKDMESGLCAMASVLCNYQYKHKINTIDKLIKRYDHTNSHKYKIALSNHLGIGIHEPFSIKHNLPRLMEGMIIYEGGKKTFNKMGLSRGKISMAIAKQNA